MDITKHKNLFELSSTVMSADDGAPAAGGGTPPAGPSATEVTVTPDTAYGAEPADDIAAEAAPPPDVTGAPAEGEQPVEGVEPDEADAALEQLNALDGVSAQPVVPQPQAQQFDPNQFSQTFSQSFAPMIGKEIATAMAPMRDLFAQMQQNQQQAQLAATMPKMPVADATGVIPPEAVANYSQQMAQWAMRQTVQATQQHTQQFQQTVLGEIGKMRQEQAQAQAAAMAEQREFAMANTLQALAQRPAMSFLKDPDTAVVVRSLYDAMRQGGARVTLAQTAEMFGKKFVLKETPQAKADATRKLSNDALKQKRTVAQNSRAPGPSAGSGKGGAKKNGIAAKFESLKKDFGVSLDDIPDPKLRELYRSRMEQN